MSNPRVLHGLYDVGGGKLLQQHIHFEGGRMDCTILESQNQDQIDRGGE
jgi:hypothetical protein